MKINEVFDRNTELMRELVQQEIDKKNLKTPQEIKKYILGLKLTGLIQYKEDVVALLQHFGIPVKLNAEAGGGGGAGGGAGGGGAAGGTGGASGGASSGGDGGSASSSGDSGSAVSGDTGSADSTPSDAPSMDAPRGYAFLGSMMPTKKKKKKKKKKSKIKFGGSIYENVEQMKDRLSELEIALQQAQEINKNIKRDDTHINIISKLSVIAENVGLELDGYQETQVLRLHNKLESACYELEEVFKDAIRDIKNEIEELEYDENI